MSLGQLLPKPLDVLGVIVQELTPQQVNHFQNIKFIITIILFMECMLNL